MTPKTLEQMAEEYARDTGEALIPNLARSRNGYLAGAKAALSLPEVRAMREALEKITTRGYPCPACDLGYDGDDCTCFDQMDETKDKVAGGREALAAFDRLLEGGEK